MNMVESPRIGSKVGGALCPDVARSLAVESGHKAPPTFEPTSRWLASFAAFRVLSSSLVFAVTSVLSATEPREVIIDFEQAEIGKPVPAWTDQGVVFSLAGPLEHSQAAGRVTFFPYLPTARKGILNAMAQEQQVPLQAKFPAPVSSVTLVLWGSTGCPAKLEAFDGHDQLIAEAAVPTVPGRKNPADPVPQFELTVRAAGIATIRL